MTPSWPERAWSAWNRLRFLQRRWLFRPREGLELPAESWEGLFAPGSDAEREAMRLQAAYGFDWADERANYLENLHVTGLLEVGLAETASTWPDPLEVLDIGAKDWHYLPGMMRFLSRIATQVPRRVEITGSEIDPYVRYRDGFSRFDYARYFAREWPSARYRVGDVRLHGGAYDLVLVLFPFWRAREVLAWGLPAEDFATESMLRHARSLLNPGGHLLVSAFQSEEPWAGELLGRLGVEPEGQGEWRSPFIRTSPIRWWRFPSVR